MSRKKLILIALIAIFTKGYSSEMGLEDVLNKLDSSNREILVQDMEVESKELGEKKQLKSMFPRASLSWDTSFIEYTDEDRNDFNSSGDSEASLTISVPLFQGGALYNNYKKSILNKENSIQGRNLVGYDVEERAISIYFEILNKKRQVEISKMVIEALEKQEKRLKSLYRSNKMIPKSELLKVQADLVLNESDLNRKIKEQRSSEEALFILLDMPLESEVEFKENSLDDFSVDIYNLESDIETALKHGSKAKQEDLTLKNAVLDTKIAKADLYPKINASAYRRLDSVPDDETEYQLSLTASWELFSWGSTIDDVKQKVISEKQALINYNNNMDSIALEVRNQYRQLEILSKDVDAQKSNLSLERENMKIDKLRYENGIISTFDYLDSLNRLSNAADNYYSVQRELVYAMKVYENLLR